MRVIISLGHVGRATRDVGAIAPGISTPEGWEITRATRFAFEFAQHHGDCLFAGFGSYSDHQAFAFKVARDNPHEEHVFIQFHANMTGVDYALVMHDQRSRKGAELASRFAPFARIVPVYDDRKDASKPWLYRAYGCISGVGDPGTPSNLCALLFEPSGVDRMDLTWILTNAYRWAEVLK